MGDPLVIPDVHAMRDHIGTPFGPSEWIEVTQDRIDRFAEATGDDQWIHTDPERARRESPFKTTVAHGYLTLSLAPDLLRQVLVIENQPTVLNVGIERMRLSVPVPAGSKVRLRGEIRKTRPMPGGGMRATIGVALELDGAARPACAADLVLVYVGG